MSLIYSVGLQYIKSNGSFNSLLVSNMVGDYPLAFCWLFLYDILPLRSRSIVKPLFHNFQIPIQFLVSNNVYSCKSNRGFITIFSTMSLHISFPRSGFTLICLKVLMCLIFIRLCWDVIESSAVLFKMNPQEKHFEQRDCAFWSFPRYLLKSSSTVVNLPDVSFWRALQGLLTCLRCRPDVPF